MESSAGADTELAAVVDLVYRKSGIALHDSTPTFVTPRLRTRLHAVGARSCAEYLSYLQTDPTGAELMMLLDAFSVRPPGFFHEPEHFALLRDRVVPDVLAQGPEPIEVWSAACSSGEEAYTLAFVLDEALPETARDRLRILASDPSPAAVAAARAGVYTLDRLRDIEPALLRKYFDRGVGPHEGLARVKAAVRQQVRFEVSSLGEAGDLSARFQVIFCRHVLIHVDQAAQRRVVSMLERRLAPGGYLFISHAESLNGVPHGLRWVAPAVYQRPAP